MSGELSCADVSDLLDVIAKDELAGADLEKRYPTALAHFRSCDRCRAAYFMLLDALRCQEEAASLLSGTDSDETASPPVLSFVDREDEERLWRRQRADAASVFPLAFEIASDFVHRTLFGPGLEGVREEASVYGEEEVFLLSDWVATESGDWIVEFIIKRVSDRPDQIDLETHLVSDDPLPRRLRMFLSWGDESGSASIDRDGVAAFRSLSLSRLINPESGRIEDDLNVTFRAEHRYDSESD